MSKRTRAFNPPLPNPRLAELLSAYPADLFDARLYQTVALAEEYALRLSIDILRRLGAAPALAAPYSAEALGEELEVRSGFSGALAWLLNRLADAGLLATDSGDPVQYCARDPLPEPDLLDLRARAAEIDSANLPTFDLLDAAAAFYPLVARGEATGEDGLLAAESIPLWLAYFNNGHPLYAVNNQVAAIAAAERLAGSSPVRILEVGAGAGSSTECLLMRLAASGTLSRVSHALITEPSAYLRRRAARSLAARFPDVPLEFASLDIDAPWNSQGAEPGAFDLVFGVNVLHTAKGLLVALSQARAALAPRGWLVAGECLRPVPERSIHIELAFQLLDSFTRVSTDPVLRPRPGFLTAEEWRGLLAAAGFSESEVIPDHAAIRRVFPSFFVGALCAR